MSLSTSTQYLIAKSNWTAPFEYQEEHSGKKVRTVLTHTLADVYQLDPARTEILCQVVEKFNSASLIHDDVLDRDKTRRGAPSVWAKYGVATALNSGMHGYIKGLQMLAEINNIELMKIGIRSLEELHIGQCCDTQVSDGDALPTLDEYKFIAKTNTGCFFLFILNGCQCLKPLDKNLHKELEKLLLELAVYYRYINDYCDINHEPHFKKKGFAPDLEGGPKSFLMILAKVMLIKQKRTHEQKRKIILEWGNAQVFTKALAMMEDSFENIQLHLNNCRKFSGTRDITSLDTFLQAVHFLQSPSDNYYEKLVR